jgi:hypothetical protein
VRHTFRLSEPGSPEITVNNSQLTGLSVYIDGEPIPRLRERGRPAWRIRLDDGTFRRVSFGGRVTGLQAIVDDGKTTTVIELERRLALWEVVLAFVPFGLLGVTGVIGGICGLIAIVVNLQIVRMPWPTAVRVLGLLLSLAVAFAVSYALDRPPFA